MGGDGAVSYCRCERYCSVDVSQNEASVIIVGCKCLFLKSHLEKVIRCQLSMNVLEWFKSGKAVNRFSCPQRDSVLSDTFIVKDVIILKNKKPSNLFQKVEGRIYFSGN